MNGAAIAQAPLRRRRAKYLLFTVIGLMMLVVMNRERALLDLQHPVWRHYEPFKWWLLPHGVTAALALFLGPLQFSTRLRQRHLRWHRYVGRIYVCGVVIAAPLGIVIEAVKYAHGIAPLRLLVGSIGFGVLFSLSTGLGFTLARRGRIQQHRAWMTRSYAIALVFLQTRCVEQIPWLAKAFEWPLRMLETHFISGLWLHMGISLIAAELALWYGRLPIRSRSLPARAAGV